MVLSRAMMQLLAPHIETCRHEFNEYGFGDAKLGACAFKYVFNQSNPALNERGKYLKCRPDFPNSPGRLNNTALATASNQTLLTDTTTLNSVHLKEAEEFRTSTTIYRDTGIFYTGIYRYTGTVF